MNKRTGFFCAVAPLVTGSLLLFCAWSEEKPQWEFNEANREKFEKYEAKTRTYREAAETAEQLRKETGDQRWAKVAEEARREARLTSGSNPYSGKWVEGPKQTRMRAFGWSLIIVGGIVWVVIWQRRKEEEARELARFREGLAREMQTDPTAPPG